MARFHATASGPVPFTEAEELARDAQESQAAIDAQAIAAAEAVEASKRAGVNILGVMCSATKEDQNGLSAVALAVTLARSSGAAFPDTAFAFANGNRLVITDANFDSVYAAWVPFRQSFFTP